MRLARITALGGGAAYLLLLRGGLTADLNVGRRIRPLGPISAHIGAPPETVFDVIATPYLGKTPRAMAGKLNVLERGSDLVIAEHFTTVGRRLKAVTVESVRFERPTRVSFRLLRGPVPHVVESYQLRPAAEGTTLDYSGELGTDLWWLGELWGRLVARRWESAVAESLARIRAEAERPVR